MSKATLKQHLSQKILTMLARAVARFHVPISIVFFIVTLVFGKFALNLEQKTTIQDLLPLDNTVVARFEETVRDFNLVDNLIVAINLAPKDMESAQNFADIFIEEVREHPEFDTYLQWIHGNLFERVEYSDWESYIQYVPKFLPPDQMPQLIMRLSPDGIVHQVRQNYQNLASGLAIKTLIEKDPLGLLDLVTPYKSEITGNYRLDLSEGYLLSQDHQMLLLLARPKKSPEDVDFSVAITEFLENMIIRTAEVYEEEEGVNPLNFLQVHLTGAHPITAHENETIRGDVISMFIGSFSMVLLLFIVAYRRPMAVFYVGIPLLSAEIWTLGAGYLLFGRLNFLTATFSAVIVGLGIDYAIHIFSRYLDERKRGETVEVAVEKALVETGIGTLTGGLTTALAFLAMTVTEFSGMREFALLAATGIFFCLVQMFVLLPSMLFIRERFRRNKNHRIREQWDFKIGPLLHFCFLNKKLVLFFLMTASIIFTYHAFHLKFNSDIRSIRAQSNPAIQLQSEVTNKVGGSLRSLTFVLNAQNEEELYELHDKVIPVLYQLKQEGLVARYDSLLSFLQNPEYQVKNIQTLKEGGIAKGEVEASFKKALAQQGFVYTAENRNYIKYLTAGIEDETPVSLEDVLAGESVMVKQFLTFGNGLYKTIIHVYPSKGLWEKALTHKVVDRILEVMPNEGSHFAFVTGIQTISDEIKRLVHDSFNLTTLIAGLLVVGILIFHFKKLSLVVLTLAPLATSVIWMLGTMVVMGVDINLLNFVATPIIIGIGIDDGIHIVEKYLHRTNQSIIKLMVSSAKAVTLTSLTTVFGFSSLFLADYSGFRSLGLSAILGVFYCWLFSVILLPLLMSVFKIKFVRKALED
ncbi:MAG: hypothetical protein CR997_00580 [Acidobacteria bacterium]|nr:MAG: hypothetical protein CR997_00580 [Acidobacteriota bacterium]